MTAGKEFDKNKQDDEAVKLSDLINYIDDLGLERLAKDISEQGFAWRIAEQKRWLDSYAFHEAVEEKFQDTIEQRLVSMNSQMFDKAASYNNLVVSFGYAGFFCDLVTHQRRYAHVGHFSSGAFTWNFLISVYFLDNV